MFLSIIIPIYNAEPYIGNCLDSLLNQDIAPTDYEIICVNDGSTDSSLAVLSNYGRRYRNIRIVNKENGGVTSARNAGLNAAQGDYIWFVDADDLIVENVFSKLLTLSGGRDRVVFGAYEFINTLTEEELDRSRKNQLTTNTSFYDSVVWRSLLRRDFLQKHQLNFQYPELTHGEDGLFMYEINLCSPSFVKTEDVFYLYRLHSGSAEAITTPEKHLRRLRSLIRVCDILHGYYRQGEKDSADRLMSFLWMTLYDVTRAPAPVAKEALLELKKHKLFPFQRLEQCTITKSYLAGEGAVGKIFDLLYLNLHRPWGYTTMQLLQFLKKCTKKCRFF